MTEISEIWIFVGSTARMGMEFLSYAKAHLLDAQ